MSFIRTKVVKGIAYKVEVESVRTYVIVGGEHVPKIRQRTVKWLGRADGMPDQRKLEPVDRPEKPLLALHGILAPLALLHPGNAVRPLSDHIEEMERTPVPATLLTHDFAHRLRETYIPIIREHLDKLEAQLSRIESDFKAQKRQGRKPAAVVSTNR